MLTSLRNLLLEQGLDEPTAGLVSTGFEVVVVLVLAFIADLIAKRIVIRGVVVLAERTATHWDDVVMKRRILHRLSHLAPALVIYHFATPVLGDYAQLSAVVRQACLIYLLLVAVFVIDASLNAAVDVVRSSRVARDLPLTSFVQVLKLILYGIAAIAVLSLILGKSPLLLFSGLGAMTAVLMLVFKDPILGFIAGIQLSANRMVALGDWIEMPKYGADGDVLEVALTTVKVQNWDKTVTTIPTYALITESFKNLARHVGIGRTADQARDQHRHAVDPLLRRGDAGPVREDPARLRVYRPQEARDRRLERGARRRCSASDQRAATDEHRHLPRVCRRLPAQPPDDQRPDDLPGAAARAERARAPHRDLRLSRDQEWSNYEGSRPTSSTTSSPSPPSSICASIRVRRGAMCEMSWDGRLLHDVGIATRLECVEAVRPRRSAGIREGPAHPWRVGGNLV